MSQSTVIFRMVAEPRLTMRETTDRGLNNEMNNENADIEKDEYNHEDNHEEIQTMRIYQGQHNRNDAEDEQ
eukprot:820348-Amphidinium_carterae.2